MKFRIETKNRITPSIVLFFVNSNKQTQDIFQSSVCRSRKPTPNHSSTKKRYYDKVLVLVYTYSISSFKVTSLFYKKNTHEYIYYTSILP